VNAVDVRAITKTFGTFTAVDAISFTIEPGEIVGLLGPNGAGKSTLIRMLVTLLPPTSGTAVINGADIVAHPDDVRRAIGVIPQAMTSDLELSARENLTIFAKLYGVPRQRRSALIDELLASVELTQWADNPVKQLSGGMRRRVEIARGLVHEPRIFFLDEPTTGLDPVSRTAVWEMLRRVKVERELTVLLTTHYMDEADKLCDRIAIIDHGKLIAFDTPARLKAAVPGESVVEVAIAAAPADWSARLSRMPGVDDVTGDGHVFHIASRSGPATTTAVLDAAAAAGLTVESIAVQSTTLDDVFLHFTGRQLRDELQGPSAADSPFVMRRS
jgi:ABC-2 type transport system ATP-binding protein